MKNLQSIQKLNVDFLSPEFIDNPYHVYDQIRDMGTLVRLSSGYWVTASHRTIDSILKDNRFGGNFWKNKLSIYGEKISEELCFNVLSQMMLMSNPPDHTRIRNSIAKYFSRRNIEELGSKIREKAHGILDAIVPHGRMDVIQDFSLPLSLQVLCEVVGIPIQYAPLLQQKLKTIARLFQIPVPLTRAELDLENSHMKQVWGFISDLLDLPEANIEGSLLSFVKQTSNSTLPISEKEAICQIIILFYASFETTPYVIANAIIALYRHPEQLQKLCAEINQQSKLSSEACNELFRYDTPTQMVNREALEDIEVDNILIKKGEKVITILAAGNRDPEFFPQPDVLDLSRSKKQIFTFGCGIHTCLGLHLASLQLTSTLAILFERLPNLQLDLDLLHWKQSYVFRGPKELLATWN